jgi:hypothetical protein
LNYGELKTLIEQYIENSENSFMDNLPMFIRLCEEDINRRVQIPAQRTSNTVTTTALNPLVPFPPGFIAPLSVSNKAPVGDGLIPILPKTEEFITELNGELANGKPQFYAIFDDENFIVAPIPDAIYTLTVSYVSDPVSITANDNDADETWLSTHAENALLYGSILQGYIYTKGDQDVIAAYQSEFIKAVEALKLLVEGRQRKDSFRRPEIRLPV